MQTQISDLWKLGRADVRFRYLSSGEHAFTRGIVLRNISALLAGTLGLSKDRARQALLVEGWRNHPENRSNILARTVRHPFNKALIPILGENEAHDRRSPASAVRRQIGTREQQLAGGSGSLAASNSGDKRA